MKQLILFILIIKFIILSTIISENLFAQPNNTHKLCALSLRTEVSKEPNPQIKIIWEKHPYAVSYEVRRKNLEDASFPYQPLATIDSNITFFIDDNVQVGYSYEYEIRANYLAKQSFRISDGQGGAKDSVFTLYFMATGYVYSGIEAVEKNFGKLLLLVDETIDNALPGEISRLQLDLIAEGWHLVKKNVPRVEKFNAQEVKSIKNIIIDEAKTAENNQMYVFLLGRVAVPYSGLIYPDGHGNHYGAWPCDGYYGSLAESGWTDISVNNNSASREENKNIPGDGKFDQSTFQYNYVDLPVGRVDFYNMPTFKKSEIDLMQQYLDKDHLYRVGELPYLNRGLIDDNFGVTINACASSGYRAFSLFFGADSVKDKSNQMDWFPTLSTNNYLWAYGCGGGDYPSAGGIGNSEQFDTINVNAVFTMLFGSYFGDWDSPNNFMRASLASAPSVLTCSWSGFPQQYYHHMGFGMPIGHSIKISQNNIYNYIGFAYLNANQWNVTTQGLGQIHVALMGDPTLRMYMGKVAEPTNLSVLQIPDWKVQISWNKPDGDDEYRYNIYRSENFNGPFEKINSSAVSALEFLDTNIIKKPVWYMVRAIITEKTNSGTFLNLSRGITKSIVINDVDDLTSILTSVSCYPNPAISELNISINLEQLSNTYIEIFNSTGNLVKTFNNVLLARGDHKLSWNLRDNNNLMVPSGAYYVRIKANDKVKVDKFTVIR